MAVLYVLPDQDSAKVVEIPTRPHGEFAERWPQGFFAERAIEIHTADSRGSDYFKSECEQRLPSLVPGGMQVHIVRWREKDGGEKLHNRYILTDIGGVSFGVGMDNGADGETDEVTLLEDKTYRLRRAQSHAPMVLWTAAAGIRGAVTSASPARGYVAGLVVRLNMT